MTHCKGIDEKGNKCKVKNAKFGLPGGKAEYCKTCSIKQNKGMVDIKNKKCIDCVQEFKNKINLNSPVQATFNYPGLKPKYCGKCAKKYDGMILVTHKKCFICNKYEPSFNYAGKPPKYCGDCSNWRETGMIDVKKVNQTKVYKNTVKCATDNCDEINLYYKYKDKPEKYCSNCRTDGMINSKKNYCDKCDSKFATYGIPGNYATLCASCAQTNKNFIFRPYTICKECKRIATHGINKKLSVCEDHAKNGEINIAIKKCKSCNLDGVLDKDNLCETCNPTKIKIIMLAKQNSLQKALESHELKFTSVDKMIDKGVCGKERPDFVIDCYKFIIILECDEYQHSDRPKSCEITRMKNIGQSYGGIPVYFIRWNPDNYKPENNIKKKDSINTRQMIVCEYIKSIINNEITLPTDSLVSAIYMYYDGWNNMNDAKWISITKFETN